METIITSFVGAERLLQDRVFSAIVSIGGSLDDYPTGFLSVQQRLRLCVNDIDKQALALFGHCRVGAPSKVDMEILIDFVRRLQPSDTCLIHCRAGLSRSPAAGFVLHAMQTEPGQEEEALAAALKSCTASQPNPNDLVIEIADDLLGRKGRMVEALENFRDSRRGMYS